MADAPGRRRLAAEHGQQAHTVDIGRPRHTEGLEDRGEDVDCAHGRADVLPPAVAWEANHHRDVQLLLVQGGAVVHAVVIHELIAVIAHQDDDRAVIQPECLELAQEGADPLVRELDLAIVDLGEEADIRGIELPPQVRWIAWVDDGRQPLLAQLGLFVVFREERRLFDDVLMLLNEISVSCRETLQLQK